MNDAKTWEVVCAICGNCVYSKNKLTKKEAHDFVENATKSDGTMKWTFPDGEMFTAQQGTCAAWARLAYDYTSEQDA